MLRIVSVLIAAALMGLTAMAHAEVRVVATTPDLAAIVREVGGKRVTVTAMSLPTQDPHFVDAKPSLALQLNKADLLVLIGLQLEVGWLPQLLTGARNGDIQPGSRGYLDCSQLVRLLDVPKLPVDRSMGDVHPGGNPHYLKDPRAAEEVAKGIASRLGELDPDERSAYQNGLKAFLEKLHTARERWEKRLLRHRGVPILGYHRTWVYFADWLGLVELEFLEPKPGIPPNPTHLARVLSIGRTRKARALLQEEYYPESTARLVAQKLGIPLLRLPSGPDFQAGQSYVGYLEEVVTQMERALPISRSTP